MSLKDTMDSERIDYNKFVDNQLLENGFKIALITEALIKKRIDDFMSFVNGVITEHASLYGWKPETREYFLNGLDDKWKYSFVIMDILKENFYFVNFSSVYGNIIHNHCTYAHKETRGFNFAKLHIIKLCQTGIENGFTHQEGYWPKNNNRSIILFLKMGWEIESIRNDNQLFMKADLKKVRNQTYNLILKEKSRVGS